MGARMMWGWGGGEGVGAVQWALGGSHVSLGAGQLTELTPTRLQSSPGLRLSLPSRSLVDPRTEVNCRPATRAPALEPLVGLRAVVKPLVSHAHSPEANSQSRSPPA
jgi:hypothetical protein